MLDGCREVLALVPHPHQLRIVAAAAVLSAACQAAPPTYEVELCEDTVRAESPFLATHVAGMLSRNRDEVLRLVPGSAEEPVEVWLQEELKLYRFSSGSFEHADGFWAEEPGRISFRGRAGRETGRISFRRPAKKTAL